VLSGTRFFRAFLAVVIVSFWLSVVTAAAQDRLVIVGSGSNVPVRLYQAWTSEFNKKSATAQVQYLPLGTSESMKQISEGSGDFGGGEVPLTNEQMHRSKVSLTQIPTVLIGIVPIYNVPGNPELNFSGELLAQIYLGTVKNWNDARVTQLNPDVRLPNLPINIVHRSPGKGSNYIFTDFLSKTSPQFRAELGTSPSPKWPLGVDANRGEDMVEKVASTQGAIGYVELNFARNSNVGYGRVKNPAGEFVQATPASTEAACVALANRVPIDFRLSLTNAPGKDSYPMTSFTWIYVPMSTSSSARGSVLKHFLSWSLQDGQEIARNRGYAPLPLPVAAKALTAVNSLH
jgi:phosphate transport system substrate-binding protein